MGPAPKPTFYAENHPRRVEAVRYAKYKVHSMPRLPLERGGDMIHQIFLDHASSALLIEEKSLSACFLQADAGCIPSCIHLGLRYLAGLNTPINLEQSTHYFEKALSYKPSNSKEVEMHASAHALLLESRGLIPRAGRQQPEPIELIYEVGEHHAWLSVCLRPNDPLPPSVEDYCYSFMRLRRETNVMVHDGLWARYAQLEIDEDLAREAKRGIMRGKPTRYYCAALGCGVESDKGKALKKCSGKCDEEDKPHYCSVECQKKHWKTHKPHCKPNGGRPAHEPLRVPEPDFDFEVARIPGLWQGRENAGHYTLPVIQTFVSNQGRKYRVKSPRALLNQIDRLPVPDSAITGDFLPLSSTGPSPPK